MSCELKLEYDEGVILKKDKVLHGGTMASYKDTLILTNKRIIYIKKGIFGGNKEIKYYPLSDVKIYNERAQVIIGKTENNRYTLDIFFNNGNESFGFELKKDIVIWIKKINELTTGKILENEEIDGASFIPNVEEIAKSVKNTIDICKDTFGLNNKKEYSCFCKSCGASNKGIKGETIKCRYCGNYITI